MKKRILKTLAILLLTVTPIAVTTISNDIACWIQYNDNPEETNDYDLWLFETCLDQGKMTEYDVFEHIAYYNYLTNQGVKDLINDGYLHSYIDDLISVGRLPAGFSPNKPEEPIEPEDPEEPEDPVEPEEPVEPVEPEDPVEPDTPDEPDEPDTPDEPEDEETEEETETQEETEVEEETEVVSIDTESSEEEIVETIGVIDDSGEKEPKKNNNWGIVGTIGGVGLIGIVIGVVVYLKNRKK